jgi:hypothetical protein
MQARHNAFYYSVAREEDQRRLREDKKKRQEAMDEQDMVLQETKSLSYLEEEVKQIHNMAGRYMDNFTLRASHWKRVMGVIPKELNDIRQYIGDLQDAFGYLVTEYTDCLGEREGRDEVDRKPLRPKTYKSIPARDKRHQRPGHAERVFFGEDVVCDGESNSSWDVPKKDVADPPLVCFAPDPRGGVDEG